MSPKVVHRVRKSHYEWHCPQWESGQQLDSLVISLPCIYHIHMDPMKILTYTYLAIFFKCEMKNKMTLRLVDYCLISLQ